MKSTKQYVDEIELETFKKTLWKIESQNLSYDNLIMLSALLITELKKPTRKPISLSNWIDIEGGVTKAIRKITAKAGGDGKHQTNNDFLVLMKQNYLKYKEKYPDIQRTNNWHAIRLIKHFKKYGCEITSIENLARKISKWK
jgi:hypothetical protein